MVSLIFKLLLTCLAMRVYTRNYLKIVTHLLTIISNADVINTNEKANMIDIPIPNIII